MRADWCANVSVHTSINSRLSSKYLDWKTFGQSLPWAEVKWSAPWFCQPTGCSIHWQRIQIPVFFCSFLQVRRASSWDVLFFFLIYTGTFIIYILYVSFFWHEDSSLLTQFFQLCLGVTLVATVLFHFHSFCLHAASDAASSVPDVTYGNALYTCRIPCYER